MAIKEDFSLDQGADFALEMHLVEKDGSKKDLTGYSASAAMKVDYNTADSDAIIFEPVIAAPATDGVVTILLDNSQTGGLNPRVDYVYDVEISFQDSDMNTVVERVLQGTINVNAAVIKA